MRPILTLCRASRRTDGRGKFTSIVPVPFPHVLWLDVTVEAIAVNSGISVIATARHEAIQVRVRYWIAASLRFSQ
ncbi:MAG: hypothetical protein LBF85_02595 [Tannerella sp.]|nr:hypothetical protein [Tannerella sp.]